MKHTDILEGMELHYTSIIGQGPSVPVIVIVTPYFMSDHWSVRVKRVNEPDSPGFSVSVRALYKRPLPAGTGLVRCPNCHRLVSVRNGRYARHHDLDRHGRRSRLPSKPCILGGTLQAREGSS